MPDPTPLDHEQEIDSHLGGCYCEAQEAGRKCTRCHVLEIVTTALAEQRERDIKAVRWALGPTRADQPEYAEEVVAAIRRGDA